MVQDGDVVLTLGAGSVWTAGEELLEAPGAVARQPPPRRRRAPWPTAWTRDVDALRDAGVPFRENEPLARHTSMGVGGPPR